ncbi:TniQ family protein [Xanthomonas albilineans]|uniref:TniQ family protein n=1 Tax=Xanthomonas albilineans TaxID=29447 RepID=UPI0005F35E0B|nr:TniQ family protein [Xanthomonas albilineans]
MKALTGTLLPAHPKPLPDELLTSWITRLARDNGLKLQTFCEHVFGKSYQLWNRDIDRAPPDWLLNVLSTRTGTPRRAIDRTTLLSYERRLYGHAHASGQLRWILAAGIYHRTRRRFGIQFCPLCLSADSEPYFRKHWRVAALTFCPEHSVLLHDRCPKCGAAIAFHRHELGRPAVTDAGALCLCHACKFELRSASPQSYAPYEASIGKTVDSICNFVTASGDAFDLGRMDVLHQLCKVIVSRHVPRKLQAYVAAHVRVPVQPVSPERQAFELRPLVERHHVIQLSAWLLADPSERLARAWRDGAVRYSSLTREFPNPPAWYMMIVSAFRRARNEL